MIGERGTRPTASGSVVHYRQWLPAASRPGSLIAIIHGFGEHADLYQDVAEVLVGRGHGVVAGDLRGHGRSPGPRGHINRWSDYREDADALVRLGRERFPGVPLVLLGNSMGGLIAIEYALTHGDQIRGVVALSPALGKLGVSPFLLALSRMMSRVWPTFSLDAGIDTEAMTRDVEVRARLDADPMVHGRGSARLGTEVPDTIARVRSSAGRLTVPLLVQHGDADTVTAPEDSRWFVERAGSGDKELKLYPGSYHNLCVDLNWREVVEDVDQWVRRVTTGEKREGSVTSLQGE